MFYLWFSAGLLFYSSLNFYGHSDIRYIISIFPCIYLLAAIVFSCASLRTVILSFAFLILNMVLVSPESPFSYSPLIILPVYLHYLIPSVTVILFVALSLFGTMERNYGIMMTGYFLLLSLGQWWIIFIMMLLFPVCFLILQKFRHVKQHYLLNCCLSHTKVTGQ